MFIMQKHDIYRQIKPTAPVWYWDEKRLGFTDWFHGAEIPEVFQKGVHLYLLNITVHSSSMQSLYAVCAEVMIPCLRNSTTKPWLCVVKGGIIN